MEGAHGDETQIKRLRRRRDHTERVLHGGESNGDTDIVEGKDEAIGSKNLTLSIEKKKLEINGLNIQVILVLESVAKLKTDTSTGHF